MTLKERALIAIDRLKKEYPDSVCCLNYGKDYELLFAVRLSAQCTDARVNMITPALFERYPTLEAFRDADFDELCEHVRSCGFYRAKAQSIKETARILLEKFDGKVPDNMDDLLSLPGVGRKTANLILGDIYNNPGIVADTHCIRISNLLGFCKTQDPYKVELALDKIIPKAERGDFCHRLVFHGRAVCVARRPNCDKCCLKDVCAHYKSLQL